MAYSHHRAACLCKGILPNYILLGLNVQQSAWVLAATVLSRATWQKSSHHACS